jgi:hypothetical protein
MGPGGRTEELRLVLEEAGLSDFLDGHWGHVNRASGSRTAR